MVEPGVRPATARRQAIREWNPDSLGECSTEFFYRSLVSHSTLLAKHHTPTTHQQHATMCHLGRPLPHTDCSCAVAIAVEVNHTRLLRTRREG